MGFETTHWMSNRKSGKTGWAELKLDMSKAYDQVEWDFLQSLMNRLGFLDEWIDKIMRCVRSVKYYLYYAHTGYLLSLILMRQGG